MWGGTGYCFKNTLDLFLPIVQNWRSGLVMINFESETM